MEIVTIILRIIHIFAGIAWVGGAWLFVFFVEPSLEALGPDAGKFMSYMVNVRRYPIYITTAAALTLLAGWTLWFLRYRGLQTAADWTFAIGGIFGLIAGFIGGAVVGRAAGQLTALGAEIGRGGKAPTPEQRTQMTALQTQMKSAGLWTAIFAALAVLCMAIGGAL
ncbi:MAG TPA: hypothetical protein VFD70_28400 [Anaerolineae bacterium]|nr:hypothetical protein [Anaerolineae bacterium]